MPNEMPVKIFNVCISVLMVVGTAFAAEFLVVNGLKLLNGGF